MSYIINVKTSDANDGCFAKTFDSLDGVVRIWIKSAAKDWIAEGKSVVAVILKNGDALANARVIEVK